MVDAGAIGIAADDHAPFVDSIERSKRRARKIIDYKTLQRIKEEYRASRPLRRYSGPPLYSCRVGVSIAEQDRARRAHRIDRSVNRAVAVAPEPMSCHPRGVNVITAALVVRIKLISQSRRRVRHHEVR